MSINHKLYSPSRTTPPKRQPITKFPPAILQTEQKSRKPNAPNSIATLNLTPRIPRLFYLQADNTKHTHRLRSVGSSPKKMYYIWMNGLNQPKALSSCPLVFCSWRLLRQARSGDFALLFRIHLSQHRVSSLAAPFLFFSHSARCSNFQSFHRIFQ